MMILRSLVLTSLFVPFRNATFVARSDWQHLRARRNRANGTTAAVLIGGGAQSRGREVSAIATQSATATAATAFSPRATIFDATTAAPPATTAPAAITAPPAAQTGDPTAVADFPAAPPVTLGRCNSTAPTLGNCLRNTAVEGQRIRRNILSVTGRDLEVKSGKDGTALYTTSGDLYTMHGHTQAIDASGAKRAVLWRWILSAHDMYEVDAYMPVCPTQTPAEDKGNTGETLYSFARMTKTILSFYTYWDVELYQCDGSLKPAFKIETRYGISWKYNYNIYEAEPESGEKSSSDPVGTVDQTYYASMAAYYDLFIAPGCDECLMTMMQIILDIDHLSKKSSGGSGGANAGGATGGGGAAAR